MPNNINTPIQPKKNLFLKASFLSNERVKIESPKNNIGSFSIPDVQKSKLGRKKSKEKNNNGFILVRFLKVKNRCRNPIKEIKHINKVWINGIPKEIN